MSAPKIALVKDEQAALIEQLSDACREARHALAVKQQRIEFLENCLQNMTHQVVRVHETYGTWLGKMQEQVNEVALAASLVPDLRRRIEFLEGQTPV